MVNEDSFSFFLVYSSDMFPDWIENSEADIVQKITSPCRKRALAHIRGGREAHLCWTGCEVVFRQMEDNTIFLRFSSAQWPGISHTLTEGYVSRVEYEHKVIMNSWANTVFDQLYNHHETMRFGKYNPILWNELLFENSLFWSLSVFQI